MNHMRNDTRRKTVVGTACVLGLLLVVGLIVGCVTLASSRASSLSAPTIALSPNPPTPADDLVCSVLTPSVDSGGRDITYSYRWYEDRIWRTELTTDTVPSQYMLEGDVWGCEVIPNNGKTDGDSAYAQVTVAARLTVDSSRLPVGSVNLPYSYTPKAHGGRSPYIWSIASGGLPDGLSLNSSSGEISGTPEMAQTFPFMMKVADSASHTATKLTRITISPLSNGSTADITPPAAINDLSVSDATSTSITLSWSAPGDDGNTGVAARYDLRYSTSSIIATNWGNAAKVSGLTAPKSPGSTETCQVSGLVPGTTYYFVVRAMDDVANGSLLSNVASRATTGSRTWGNRILCLHHSVGSNVYNYPAKGVLKWLAEYNSAHGTSFQISDQSYPSSGNNMPIDYYNSWVVGTGLDSLVQNYDVIIMKHCYPSSSILADAAGEPDFSSRQSIANYKAIYRALRAEFDAHPDKLFIVWTLPPRHRLDTDADEAARATQFSQWLKTDFLTEGGSHPNIRVFDFRSIVMDPSTNFLKYEYEKSHTIGDSHPNDAANNVAGPLFAQFIVDAISNRQ